MVSLVPSMIKKKYELSEVPVHEFMVSNPYFTTPDAKISATELLMLRKKIGGLPVVKDEISKEVIGIITQRDIRLAKFAMNLEVPNTRVRDLMTPDPIVVHRDDSLRTVLTQMFDNKIERLPVINESNELIGLVIQNDILLTIYHLFIE
jgi:IMP dehydrogenase